VSLRSLALLSAQAGSGRSTLAAELGAWLGREQEAWLLERCEPGSSEAALRRDTAPEAPTAALTRRGPGLRHVALTDLGAAAGLLQQLAGRGVWAILDAVDLGQADAEAWTALCGRVLVLERGDLQGCRRALQDRRALERWQRPLSSALLAWSGENASQPLPTVEGLRSVTLPWDPKAWERLAQGRLWALEEPKGPLAKALPELLRALETLTPADGPAAASSAVVELEEAWLRALSTGLRDELGPILAAAPTRDAAETLVRGAIDARLAREESLSAAQRAGALRRLMQDMLGLGPLEDLLADPAVSEIMVNHPGQVYVERAGRLSLSPLRFQDERQLRSVIERIVWPLGRRIDESSPKVDARLPDGSRVNAIIPPLALKGSCLTIRRFPARRPSLEELVAGGSLSPAAAELLHQAVRHKKNILVSGGTGSGKTTLLNALSACIPEGERVITLEDAAELKLQQAHVVTLEARPANVEGQGEVTIRELLKNALRMRPDRIVVGECRGGEALDMLQAMNTGHEGSLSTLHANNPREALQRLETLCLLSGVDLPLKVARQQIASAIDVIVQVGRLRDGSRKVLAVTELVGMEGEVLQTQDLFLHQARGTDAEGRLQGSLQATGIAARFYGQLRDAGESVDFGVFA
jgi:pilus assembly protein CpaF